MVTGFVSGAMLNPAAARVCGGPAVGCGLRVCLRARGRVAGWFECGYSAQLPAARDVGSSASDRY